MRLFFLLLSLFCLGAGLLFGALNPQPARIDFYWFAFDGSLGVLLLLAALAGALAGGAAVVMGMVWPLQQRLRAARRANASREPATLPALARDASPPLDAERS
jgi:lipopolysaccharide assembly protein A